MPIYTCEKCARTFKQKSGYDDHKAKKNDCIKNTMIHTIIEKKVQEALSKTNEDLPRNFYLHELDKHPTAAANLQRAKLLLNSLN